MEKTLKRSAVAILMAAGIVGVGGVTAAQAAPEPSADAPGAPSAGGSAVAPENAEVTIDGTTSEGDVSTYDTESVGGGTWSYGTYADGIWKGCYSNYKHNTKYHSSAAAIADASVTDYASAGYWSRADASAGWAHTCYAYWNTY